jgi:uncharacterized membrane protein
MAGIGFALNRLSRRDDLGGAALAFLHGTVASSGPWLLTVLCLATVTLLATPGSGQDALTEFRVLIMYNFAFSLFATGGLVRLMTRLLADQLYGRDVTGAPGMLVGALIVSTAVQLPLVAGIYFLALDLPPLTALAATINYFLVASIWLLGIFLSALKVYGQITLIFAAGLATGLLGAVLAAETGNGAHMLLGFSGGLALIVIIFGARILAEYPGPVRGVFAFLSRMRTYRSVFAAGLLYSAAIWVDKWIMWFAPESERLPSGLVYFSNYDSAMFLAFVTTVPALTIFLVNMETRFFRNYLGFYRAIESQATLADINANHRSMTRDLAGSFRNVFLLQGLISLACIMLAPLVLELFETDFVILGIFRLGVLGAFFHTMLLLVTIVLSYFDLRRSVLAIYGLFLVLNAAFTWLSMSWGFSAYGAGYCLASIVTFLAAALVLARQLGQVPFLTFVRNPSVTA